MQTTSQWSANFQALTDNAKFFKQQQQSLLYITPGLGPLPHSLMGLTAVQVPYHGKPLFPFVFYNTVSLTSLNP